IALSALAIGSYWLPTAITRFPPLPWASQQSRPDEAPPTGRSEQGLSPENPEPKAGYIWVPGHWERGADQYVWIDGHWERQGSSDPSMRVEAESPDRRAASPISIRDHRAASPVSIRDHR